MTPDTTPAPMTHEEALAAVDDALRIFAERHWHADHKAMRRVRAHIEAERTRADALAAKCAELSGKCAEQTAKCAELEAGIGRLADNLEWLRTTGNPSLKGWAKAREDEARSLIGHKEG